MTTLEVVNIYVCHRNAITDYYFFLDMLNPLRQYLDVKSLVFFFFFILKKVPEFFVLKRLKKGF